MASPVTLSAIVPSTLSDWNGLDGSVVGDWARNDIGTEPMQQQKAESAQRTKTLEEERIMEWKNVENVEKWLR
jgi:hypothetical protein